MFNGLVLTCQLSLPLVSHRSKQIRQQNLKSITLIKRVRKQVLLGVRKMIRKPALLGLISQQMMVFY
ncbi:hypothetical protein BBG06_01735 [Streptococcus dysgalactiae subsp. equisimilis]|nr:hypothetical protein SDE12394_01770 [Streptococcus dysgalactiae subsp. equisimilis ATCC 12394]KKC18779.1 hypothetical protein WH81_01445 [Streptococcus dysgalactiae subsp. equisimilis]OCX07148.1 hypothetical protein GCS_01210 [Streptococcus dysgalactiae subsp. equisimilis AKSDE4288]QFZ09056.1 hypothetical protein EBL83_01770 [Streptococcus dysgalactiae]KKC20382.1 hypothetical protein WH14_02610 [Streptococcus dysgalactiae subsp. equisimilis]